jgi:O-antigen/teichoic acid export membrane protein
LGSLLKAGFCIKKHGPENATLYMQRKFLKNLVLLLVLNLLIKPFWILGIDRAVQNTVGAADYGFYFAIINFSFLFNILLDFGITNFNNRNIAQNGHLLGKHLPNIFVLKMLLFGVYLVFTFGGAFFINYSREQILMLGMLAFNQFLMSFILYLRSNLSGLHLFRTDSLISVLDRSLMIIIVGVLLWGNVVDEFKIRYFVFAQTVSYLLTFSITFIIVLRKAGTRLFRLSWDPPFMRMIIRQSLPFALLVLLMTFYNRVDSVMLERMLFDGARYSGIYASAYRLLDAVNQFSFLFAVLLLPIFSRMIKQNQAVASMVQLSLTLVITPALILAIGSFSYSGEIMRLLYPVHAGETILDFAFRMDTSSRVFALLMLCFIGTSANYIFGTLLTANGSLKELNLISLGGMTVNIVLNILLIPHYHAVGSAFASLVTQTLVALAQVFVVFRIFKFRPDYWFIIRLLLLVAGIILISLVSFGLPFSWIVNLVIMGVSSLLLAMLVRFFRIGYFLSIMRFGEQPGSQL